MTFNYDTLLESGLSGIDLPVRSSVDYFSPRQYQLFKLHGSIDWSCWFRRPTTLAQNEQPTPAEMIRAALVLDDNVVIDRVPPPDAQRVLYFSLPALAVPTVSKQTFLCPKQHIAVLRNLIPAVSKILVVGWRAAEQHFLDILAKGIKKDVKILAVCGSTSSGEETIQRISATGVPGDAGLYDGGFSDFVVERGAEQFLLDHLIDSPRYKPFLARR